MLKVSPTTGLQRGRVVRIISGIHKGRSIKATKGLVTRPTGSRVREAVFSSLTALPFEFEGAVVGDLFAGSGAYGFEALSRGARRVVFVDTDPAVLKMLSENVNLLNESSRSKVLKNDSLKFPGRVLDNAGYDLLFLDPPYKVSTEDVMQMLQKLVSSDAINDNATIVFEHDAKVEVESFDTFSLRNSRKYGTTTISYLIYKKE